MAHLGVDAAHVLLHDGRVPRARPLPALVEGSVVIEVVFNIPGMGQYIYQAINLRDYNAVMAVLLTSSFLALIGILISDLSYALVDPRISFD